MVSGENVRRFGSDVWFFISGHENCCSFLFFFFLSSRGFKSHHTHINIECERGNHEPQADKRHILPQVEERMVGLIVVTCRRSNHVTRIWVMNYDIVPRGGCHGTRISGQRTIDSIHTKLGVSFKTVNDLKPIQICLWSLLKIEKQSREDSESKAKQIQNSRMRNRSETTNIAVISRIQ